MRFLYDTGSVLNLSDKKRSGAPSMLTEEEKTLIVARAVDDPFVTPGMIKAELDLACSTRTIDNLWADLSSRVFDRNPCGVDELRQYVSEEWMETDVNYLKKLARSMKKRMAMVIENKGHRIRY